MSEELSVGVRILLERCKTNPEEIMGHKWLGVIEAVFNYKETRQRNPYLRGLTEQEIDLIYEALNGLYRAKFDSYIMANVLDADEEKEYSTGTFKTFTETMRLDANGNLGLGSHTWRPGGIYETQAIQTSNTPIAAKLKNALGIK